MPVQKISFTHRFGIISATYQEKIQKDIQRKDRESDGSSLTTTTDSNK
jgi:hypothetical protein